MDMLADLFEFCFSFFLLMEDIHETLKEENIDCPFDEECNTTYSGVGSTESSPGVGSASRVIYGWQTGCYLNRGLNRHTNCIELDTDMTDRFIVELKQRKKKRGLLTRLRFWKKQSKSGQVVPGIDSAEINKSKYKHKQFTLCSSRDKLSKCNAGGFHG